ncbi:MAG: hypothetical protein K2X47_19805 [Bdellovibrionales bacterium]|nr:hypothetical protein [Bdellovibrionales bacterium]
MKLAMVLILLSMTGCATYHSTCEESDRKSASEGLCKSAEMGAPFTPVIDPSIRY